MLEKEASSSNRRPTYRCPLVLTLVLGICHNAATGQRYFGARRRCPGTNAARAQGKGARGRAASSAASRQAAPLAAPLSRARCASATASTHGASPPCGACGRTPCGAPRAAARGAAGRATRRSPCAAAGVARCLNVVLVLKEEGLEGGLALLVALGVVSVDDIRQIQVPAHDHSLWHVRGLRGRGVGVSGGVWPP